MTDTNESNEAGKNSTSKNRDDMTGLNNNPWRD